MLDNKTQEIEKYETEIQQLNQELTDHKELIDAKTIAIDNLQSELEQNTDLITNHEQQIQTQQKDIQNHLQTIEKLESELGSKQDDLTHKNSNLISKEKQLQELQTELQSRVNNLEKTNNLLTQQKETISKLQNEKEQISFQFNRLKDSIPSSVVLLDKDNNIVNWNKRAEEMLGLSSDSFLGKNASALDIMKKERIVEKMKAFDRDKKPVKINAISVKNKNGDVTLTNVSKRPMHNKNGELQGSIMVFDDISETEHFKSELQRKETDLRKLDSKFQDVYTKFKLVSQDKTSMDEHLQNLGTEKEKQIKHFSRLLEEKQNELNNITNQINAKTGELEDVTTRLQDNRASLQTVENELSRRRTELENTAMNDEILSKTWKEKLKIYDEIDKTLGVEEQEILKTKKLEAESETEE